MKKLILMLLLCIPSLIYATNDNLTTGTEIEGKYTVTATGETYRLNSYQNLPKIQASVVIEMDPLPEGEYYDIYLKYVTDNQEINWFVEPDGYKCYFSIDSTPRHIVIEVVRRKGSTHQDIINVREFRFTILE